MVKDEGATIYTIAYFKLLNNITAVLSYALKYQLN